MHSFIQQTLTVHFPTCQALHSGWFVPNCKHRKTLPIWTNWERISLNYWKVPTRKNSRREKLIYFCQDENWAMTEKQRSSETYFHNTNRKWKLLSRVQLFATPVVHGILQARILEWVAFALSRGSSQPRDQTQVSCIAGRFFITWATGKHKNRVLDKLTHQIALCTQVLRVSESNFLF